MTPADPTRLSGQETMLAGFGSRLLERMLPPSVRSAGIEERLRARILVGFTLVLCFTAVAIISIQATTGAPAGVILGLAVGTVHVAIIIAIRAGIPIRWMSQVLIGSVYLFSVGVVIASGAKAGSAVLASSLIPLISILVAGRRSAFRWTLATLAGLGATAFYASTTSEFIYAGQVLTWDQARIPVIAATVIIVHAATMAFDNARAQAIREAANSRKELERQEGRYRGILENMGDVLMDFDENGNCVFVSPTCVDVLGLPEKSFLGLGYLEPLHPDDLEPLHEYYRFCRAHPGATRLLPLRFHHPNQDWLHIQASMRGYYTEEGKIHFLVIIRDTTDMRIAEMTIRHKDRLSSAGTLSAGIAHQINNPIGSILNASEFGKIALNDGDLDSVEQALNDNIEQASRCGKIVRSLLHFSAREAPATGKEDLVEVIRRAREFTLSYAGENSIQITISGHREPLWVEISAIEIEQVLINLLRNAIEAKPLSKSVDVSVSVVDSDARVEVQDDGHGIAPHDQNQIFDPFYTTRIREGGSGLGLSVAHGIIRDHGGRMEVISDEGKGTCVRLEIPLSSQ